MERRARLAARLAAGAVAVAVVATGIYLSEAASAVGTDPVRKTVVHRTLANGRVSTITTMPNGDTWTITGPEATDSDVKVTLGTSPEGASRVTVDGSSQALESDALLPAQGGLATTGDQGCGGKVPAVAWSFNGRTSSGTWEGALATCRDSVGTVKAYAIDKMFMRAKGVPHLFHDSIPDTFWVQAYTHTHAKPEVLDADPVNSISDTAGACTSYSVGISGNVASAGMSGSVCRGTMSPILGHAVTVGGTASRSYGVKYEGKNLLMDGGTTYGIKGVGWRRTDKYSAAKPHYNFVGHSGFRWHIDFDTIG